MPEVTKIVEKLTINAPGKNVTIDGIDFTGNGMIEVVAAKSVTVKNCRIYDLASDAVIQYWLSAASGNETKVTLKNCFLGNNGSTETGKFRTAELNKLADGSSISENYFKVDSFADHGMAIKGIANGGTFKFNENEFEGFNPYQVALSGAPTGNFQFNDNKLLGEEVTDPKESGLVEIAIDANAEDLSGITIEADNLETAAELDYPIFGTVTDDATVTKEQVPTINMDGEDTGATYWNEEGEASDIGNPDKDPTHVAKIGDTWYATLQEAIDAAPNNVETTILLKKDVEGGSGIATWQNTPKNIIIDFEGHTYEMTKPAVGSTGTTTQALHLEQGTTFVMKNGNFVVGAERENVKMLMQNYCDLTMDNMLIDMTNVILSIYSFPPESPYYEEWNGRSVPIFNFNNGNSVVKDTILIFPDADTNGVYVETATSQYPNGGHVVLEGATNNNGLLTSAETSRLVITGGLYSKANPTPFVPDRYKAVMDDNNIWHVMEDPDWKPVATCGDGIYGKLKDALAAAVDNDTVTLLEDCPLSENFTFGITGTVTILLDGHQITDAKSIIIPNGLTVIADHVSNRYETTEGFVINWKTISSDPYRVQYTVVPTTWPVTIRSQNGDEVRYEDLITAEKAMTDGDILILNEDMPSTSVSMIAPKDEVERNATIDLNGHTVQGVSSAGRWTTTVNGNGIVTNTASSATKAAQANGGSGMIIIDNGTFTAGIAAYCAPGYNETTAELIINGGDFTGTAAAIKIDKAGGSARTNHGKITINGGTFHGAIVVPEAAEPGSLTINGGTFDVDPTAWKGEYTEVTDNGDGTFTVIPINQ